MIWRDGGRAFSKLLIVRAMGPLLIIEASPWWAFLSGIGELFPAGLRAAPKLERTADPSGRLEKVAGSEACQYFVRHTSYLEPNTRWPKLKEYLEISSVRQVRLNKVRDE